MMKLSANNPEIVIIRVAKVLGILKVSICPHELYINSEAQKYLVISLQTFYWFLVKYFFAPL